MAQSRNAVRYAFRDYRINVYGWDNEIENYGNVEQNVQIYNT